MVVCHDPHSLNSRTGTHECNFACAQLYPFQKCSSICGIVLVMVAIACHNFPLFKLMSTTCISQRNTNQPAAGQGIMQTTANGAPALALIIFMCPDERVGRLYPHPLGPSCPHLCIGYSTDTPAYSSAVHLFDYLQDDRGVLLSATKGMRQISQRASS